MTDAEVARAYGCDALIADPAFALWRGVTVAAPADRVWPWVGQLRVAPYSYDLVDNLGRRSPRRLLGLPEPAVGDRFALVGRLVGVEPGVELTGEIGRAGGPLGRTLMSYRLEPAGSSTRLLLKVVVEATGPARRLLTATLPLGDLVMARRQLRTLRDLAQTSPAAANTRV